MTDTIMTSLESLYTRLPDVSCEGCGSCCVSPTCMLVEFIYLFRHAPEVLGADSIREIMRRPAQPHPHYEGNLICPLLCNGRCSVYHYRTGACRLFGVSSLAQFGVDEMVFCSRNAHVVTGDGSFEYIQDWITRLVDLESGCYSFDTEPYFLKGLSLQCWLDIYFDETLNFDLFWDIQNLLHKTVDLEEFRSIYTPKTTIREKLEKITLLWSLLCSGDREKAMALTQTLFNNYPDTGTYYRQELLQIMNFDHQGWQ